MGNRFAALVVLTMMLVQLAPVGFAANTTFNPWREMGGSLAQQTCELVELNQGYPSYRGLVAGLVGHAETACLKDLEASDPTFSKSEQDQENDRVCRATRHTRNQPGSDLGGMDGDWRCLWIRGDLLLLLFA